MKKICSISFLLFNLWSFSQTKLIALKSHSGNLHSIVEESDGNFGIAPVRLDSVIKISSTCIVEIDNFGHRDTVYDHPTFLNPKVTLEELKKQYPRIKFVGFDQKWKGVQKTTPKHRKSGFIWMGIMITCLFFSRWLPKRTQTI